MCVAHFGGSFDPVHQGHLLAAELLRQLEALDRVFVRLEVAAQAA